MQQPPHFTFARHSPREGRKAARILGQGRTPPKHPRTDATNLLWLLEEPDWRWLWQVIGCRGEEVGRRGQGPTQLTPLSIARLLLPVPFPISSFGNRVARVWAGVIAGAMTKSNTLGVVGSIPIPEVIRNINSFTMGAQSVNPKVTTKVVWVGEWFNPPKETEAAQSLINGGADVLMQNTDSSAVLQTADKNGKRAFGWDSDMQAYAPKAHLGSAIINWAPYYSKAVKDALDGTWSTGTSWWGVKEGAIDMVSVADDVPADIKAKVDEIRAGLKDGSFAVWTGPIVDNTGKEQVAAGVKADDAFLGGVKFYVKGVEGQVPGN